MLRTRKTLLLITLLLFSVILINTAGTYSALAEAEGINLQNDDKTIAKQNNQNSKQQQNSLEQEINNVNEKFPLVSLVIIVLIIGGIVLLNWHDF
ncbi:hypothetical protein [Virgibacillus oceani]|uniref:Uncharacterized protein n=1 Tax=Virgibacillus oceani TaxID=1479511 RepID=A0A917LVP2_9BACI|nr:hypothetical protein [Virgibacillus oceani]GGG61366.1 hypothetical protein GCM10011398_00820 [Virgibacillus oceani]